MIKVFIADDHQLFLEGIAALVSSIAGVEVVDTALNGVETIQKIQLLDADVLLLDINMPGLTGLEVLEKLKRKSTSLKIIMLTMHNNYKVVQEVLKAGADGYLLKNSEKSDLEAAIKSVYNGESYFVDEVKDVMMDAFRSQEMSNEVKLTPREKEVLDLICKEYTTQSIAEKLFLSVNTIESHRKNLLSKTGSKNSVGLVKFAYENGLI